MVKQGPVLVTLAVLQLVLGHTYHYGPCPYIPGMEDFDVAKFAGKWYVMEKTSTSVRCLQNNFSPTHLLQTMVLGIPGVNPVVRYEGELSTPDPNLPARMQVKFPLSVAGQSSYNVIDTDYDNYAVTYTCQKLGFFHRHSASIMSRRMTLHPSIIKRLRLRLQELEVDPEDLDPIEQDCMNLVEDGLKVNIGPDTFKPSNVKEYLSNARDAVNDAAEISKTAYALYNAASLAAAAAGRKRREVEIPDVDIPDWLP